MNNRDKLVKSSILYKFDAGQFDHLSWEDKNKLIFLIARISEKSYKRGVMQGRFSGVSWKEDKVAKWRYSGNVDKSTMYGAFGKKHEEDVREFLFAQNTGLRLIGLGDDICR